MPYSIEDSIEPFWGENIPVGGGRDPLAIQNSSVVIYSKMICGITNVTNRIRYNGFYCWMIETIHSNIEENNVLKEQIKYLRRGELLLAYIMVNNFPEITGVSGSAYAGKYSSANIDLGLGSDHVKGNKLYWKYPTGAFGQYFIGVMSDLELITHPVKTINIYSLTDKGKILAQAFRESINAKAEKQFWKYVLTGKLQKSSLKDLVDFSLVNIPAQSGERKFYDEMLLAGDNIDLMETFFRRESIQLILKFLKATPQGTINLPLDFLYYNYEQCRAVKNIKTSTSIIWYLYEINELVHVAFEHFHGCFMRSLDALPESFDDIINSLLEEIKNSVEANSLLSKRLSVLEFFRLIRKNNKGAHFYFDEMIGEFQNGNYGNSIYNALCVFLKVYQDTESHLSDLKNTVCNEFQFDRPGYAIELFEEFIQPNWDLNILELARNFFLNAINRHIYSSYTKSKIGQGLKHNYLIEENMAWKLRENLPNRTSPRLQNVCQYLIDIAWLTKQNKTVKISSAGKTIIARL